MRRQDYSVARPLPFLLDNALPSGKVFTCPSPKNCVGFPVIAITKMWPLIFSMFGPEGLMVRVRDAWVFRLTFLIFPRTPEVQGQALGGWHDYGHLMLGIYERAVSPRESLKGVHV